MIAVLPAIDDERVRARAASLAAELSLPCLRDCGASVEPFELCLRVGTDRLELQETGQRRSVPIVVDFASGAIAFRRRSTSRRRDLLARAIGCRQGTPTVIDATAGLGRDAFLLACLGCRVQAVERSPILAALLRDGLARALRAPDAGLREIVERISLSVADARDVLPAMGEASRADVVYLDPMYPPKRKSAQVKKEMRICRRLVGTDADSVELVTVARGVARRRVVVKRHPHAPPLLARPSLRWVGRTVRYDVYLRSDGE